MLPLAFPRQLRSLRVIVRILALLLVVPAAHAGVYVTETSGIRWNDVGGVRWNDVGGIGWMEANGIRWNDVGGIRWNDVGGVLFTDASGVRWNDVGGIRWNDVGGLEFDDALATGGVSLDLELLGLYSGLPDSSSINVIVSYRTYPSASDLAHLVALGVHGGTRFRRLPMVVVNATKPQIAAIAALPAVRSVYANRTLSFFDDRSGATIGLPEVEADVELAMPGGGAPTGSGVTIAVLDTGVDTTHPDLPYGGKVVENVRLNGAIGSGPGFIFPAPVAGLADTDLVLGHGTFVASVAAGSGAASGGLYRGVAPGASILGLAAGDLFILNVLEGFDYILDNAARFGVRVVNCSWGTTGWFDPDDPVNIATHLLYDGGISVVFAAGNHGPSPDTLNAYAVAPWVIGVGSTRIDGSLSAFSSRGIFEELIYHPTLVAPGEGIIAACPVALHAANGGVGVPDPTAGVTVPPTYDAYYVAASGTSFAAPHVAGVIARMLEASPGLAPGDIKRILQQSATPMPLHDRSQVGAGRLDAWAALALARYPSRPFGSFVPSWLDARPYRIEHRAPSETMATVPAQGIATVPIHLDEPVLALGLDLAWGTSPGLADLDVTVRDACGAEWSRSESLNGAALFGRAEGVRLLGAVPADLSVEVSFKAGTGAADQPFRLRREAAVAVAAGLQDVAGLAPQEQQLVAAALARHALVGRGSLFEPAAALGRGELARSLALLAGVPQRVPSTASFVDTPAADPAHPFVESVAGARAGRVLIDPLAPGVFGSDQEVRRLDFAVSLVRAAGRAAEAESRAGESLGLADEAEVPAALRGYVAIALERGFLDPITTGSGSELLPDGSVPRLDAARFLLNLLADIGPPAPGPCSPDGDADGVPDASDCLPQDPGAWALPGEASSLVFLDDGETLQWQAPTALGGTAVVYDLLRSPSGASFAGAACVDGGGLSAAEAVEDATPGSGSFLYYLVRASNACGPGPLGTDSAGTPREGPPCP